MVWPVKVDHTWMHITALILKAEIICREILLKVAQLSRTKAPPKQRSHSASPYAGVTTPYIFLDFFLQCAE